MQFQSDIKETYDRSICSYIPRTFLAAPFPEIRLDFTKRSYYPRKLVLANARSGKTVPTRGSRAGPTTHPHSRIKHKCHLLCLILTSREHLLFFFSSSCSPSSLSLSLRVFFPVVLLSRVSRPPLLPIPVPAFAAILFHVAVCSLSNIFSRLRFGKCVENNSGVLYAGVCPWVRREVLPWSKCNIVAWSDIERIVGKKIRCKTQGASAFFSQSKWRRRKLYVEFYYGFIMFMIENAINWWTLSLP